MLANERLHVIIFVVRLHIYIFYNGKYRKCFAVFCLCGLINMGLLIIFTVIHLHTIWLHGLV